MLLTFSAQDADAYPIDETGDNPHWFSLEDAIAEESHNVASEADSEHLEDPSEETREAFRQRVVKEATAALRAAGDSYKDPTGVTWRLVAREPEVYGGEPAEHRG